MGRQITTGELCRELRRYRVEEEEKSLSLTDYIAEKVKLLHEMYYNHVTKETFVGCKNEIQVDNRARTIIFGAQKYMVY